MAHIAYFRLNFRNGRPSGELVAAHALYGCFGIIRGMDIRFHTVRYTTLHLAQTS